MNAGDALALRVTLTVAASTTALLLLIGLPLAWWLANARSRLVLAVESLVALPLVLPPTVLGFYMLVLLGPRGAVGGALQVLGVPPLTFSIGGLVAASVVSSLPFMVQPLRDAFAAVGRDLVEAAATLRAGAWDRFFSVVLPLSWRGLLGGVTLSFAHTVGEFGVVLMVGGNIPGRTRMLSIAIYDHVEALDYAAAHRLSAALLLASFVALLAVNATQRRRTARQGAVQ